MNQILYRCFAEKNNKKVNKYVIIIGISILLIIIAIIVYFITKLKHIQNEKISKKLVSSYSIMTLYSENTSSYEIEHLTNETEPFVIGLIQIEKIGITYPIISNSTPELLKIAPCKFSGPNPNEDGNLCIAGHNYVDNKQFSNLHQLEKNDIIKIFDLTGSSMNYLVYEKKEILSDDWSCIEQNINNQKEITLITCNNVNGKRVCIKANEQK